MSFGWRPALMAIIYEGGRFYSLRKKFNQDQILSGSVKVRLNGLPWIPLRDRGNYSRNSRSTGQPAVPTVGPAGSRSRTAPAGIPYDLTDSTPRLRLVQGPRHRTRPRDKTSRRETRSMARMYREVNLPLLLFGAVMIANCTSTAPPVQAGMRRRVAVRRHRPGLCPVRTARRVNRERRREHGRNGGGRPGPWDRRKQRFGADSWRQRRERKRCRRRDRQRRGRR